VVSDARSEIGWPATTTKSRECRGRIATATSQPGVPHGWAGSTPGCQQGLPADEDRLKRSTRPITAVGPEPASATTDSAKDFRQVPSWEVTGRHGCGGSRPVVRRRRAIRRAGALRPRDSAAPEHQHRRPFRRHSRLVRRIRGPIISPPAPTRSGAGADRRGGIPGRQTADFTGWPQYG